MDRSEVLAGIAGEVGLAALQGTTDGAFCREAGLAGAGFVTLGCMNIDKAMIEASGVFHPREGETVQSFLTREIEVAKCVGIPLLVNIHASSIDSVKESAQFCEKAGADIYELNAHCAAKKVMALDSGKALLQNTSKLMEWVTAVRSVTNLPIVVKTWAKVADDIDLAAGLRKAGADGMHMDLRLIRKMEDRLSFIYHLSRNTDFFLIGSGGITNGMEALEFLDAGLSSAAVGTAAVKKPKVVGQINNQLKLAGEQL